MHEDPLHTLLYSIDRYEREHAVGLLRLAGFESAGQIERELRPLARQRFQTMPTSEDPSL